MKRPITREPTRETVALQARATVPDHFAWVSANAGSGKTTVLVRRIQRLLLSGVQPPQIQCLTYTEAAAANMKNRLLAELSDWVGRPEEALAGYLALLLGRPALPRDLRRARELFAVALQSPGGLKIGTIHGFCTRILQIAPFEANVPSRFDVLDETSAGLLMREALDQVLARAAYDEEMAQALGVIGEELSGRDGLMDLVRGMADRRHLFLDADGEPVAGPDYLRLAALALGVDPKLSAETVISDALRRTVDTGIVRAWRDLLAQETHDKDVRFRKCFDGVLAATSQQAAFHCWSRALLSGKGAVMAPHYYLLKETAARFQDIRPVLLDMAPVFEEASARLRSIGALQRSAALHHVVCAVLAAYARRKLARRALDFADLIAETRSLLSRVEADWLLYKLDAEIEHLLVDEAQDTSVAQWDIIASLTQEFTAGAGVRSQTDPARTVFAVGDDKQSIYSFQGAQPEAFDEQRRLYRAQAERAGLTFSEIRLNESFRSTRPIMSLVDAVFGVPERWHGLSPDPRVPPQRHATARGDDLGAVDLWPLVPRAPVTTREAWDAPPDTTGTPEAVLARRIAQQLAAWTEARRDDLGRRFAPGDVLILLRSRNALFREIIRALRVARVPVAGVDRLNLTRHIAVQDLIVIGEALLLPDDDLALATALKTPVFGLDDEDLLRLTEGQTDSLITALRAATDPRLIEAATLFGTLAALRQARGPYGFYADLLGRLGGYRRMVGRLGTEAADAIDAWLSAALAHEKTHGPTLAGFLAQMRLSETEVKRDLAEQQGEVRVMTVHGAKGLEAPIVILPDTGPDGRRGPALRIATVSERGRDHHVPLWIRSTSEQETGATAQVRAEENRRAEDERNRLLYVALTRAEDRLIIAGLEGKPVKEGAAPPSSAWYWRIQAGFEQLPDAVTVEGPDGMQVKRVSSGVLRDKPLDDAPPLPFTPPPAGWLRVPARIEIDAAPPMTASSSLGAADGDMASDRTDIQAWDQPIHRARGLLAHLLLQHLPAVQPEMRDQAARRLAAGAGDVIPPALRDRVMSDVLDLLAHPDLEDLFGPDSLAEVPVAGRVTLDTGERRQADGRIDRLVIRGDTVLFADFKTAPVPPATIGEVPGSVLRQMAIYAALLRAALPGRRVSALLIYTSGPCLLPLSAEQLAAISIRGERPFKAA